MEGLEVLAKLPQVWGERVQRGFIGNRLERDILAHAYELLVPRPRALGNRQSPEVGGGQRCFVAGGTATEEGGLS